jgi:hypothetical protein
MPSIEDLRAAYATLKDQAPTEINILPSHATEQHRRRFMLPALVAAGVVVAVAGSLTLADMASSNRNVHTAAASGAPSTLTSTGATPVSTAAAPVSVASYPVLPATGSIFTVGKLPAGLRASDGITSPFAEQMTLDSSDGKLAGVISVVPASAWHPSIPADAVPVKVDGQPGYYGTLNFDGAMGNQDSWFAANGSFLNAGDADEAGVLWQDPSGVWAYVAGVTNVGVAKQAAQVTIGSGSVPRPTGSAVSITTTGAAGPTPAGPTSSVTAPNVNTSSDPYTTTTVPGRYAGLPTASLSQSQAVAVANAIQIGSPRTATVPIKLGYLPAGFKAEDTANLADSALASVNPNRFIGGITISTPDATNPIFNTLYIGVSSGSIAPGVSVAYKEEPFVLAPKSSTINIAGYTGSYSPDSPLVVLRNGTVSLSIGVSDGPGKGVPLAELTKLVQGITLASNLSDQSTWFPADKAFG